MYLTNNVSFKSSNANLHVFFQVMGEGNKRVVTLSHRAQVRRFTSDLLRVLKSKASKQVALSEFPNVYSRVIGINTFLCFLHSLTKNK